MTEIETSVSHSFSHSIICFTIPGSRECEGEQVRGCERLYIIKRFRRRRVKNREGGEGRGGEGGGRGVEGVEVEASPQGLIILSPPKAGLF